MLGDEKNTQCVITYAINDKCLVLKRRREKKHTFYYVRVVGIGSLFEYFYFIQSSKVSAVLQSSCV